MGKKERILVTGSSGFIGMNLCLRLIEFGFEVLGIDNMNNLGDPKLKKSRLNKLIGKKSFSFIKADISNLKKMEKIFEEFKPNKVVNLAAQAGVRYSLENPHIYIESNIKGFMNILECCKNNNIEGLIYASSSSVYGSNEKYPFSVKDRVDHPISIYAATKKANELLAYTYSHLYDLNTTGLRFFTVYGPWGRHDMAMYLFAKKILNDEPIQLFNQGRMERDFTFIDDIVDGIMASINKNYKCEIFNLGNNKSVHLKEVIKTLEKSISKKAIIDLQPMQPGDVKKTFADIDYTIEKLGFSPKINIYEGIPLFIKWFKKYNKYS